jgi:tetratricopeptide (TPR) repeat protein
MPLSAQLVERAYEHFLAGRDVQAKALLFDAIKENPNQAQAYYILAIIEYQGGELGSAYQNVNRAITLYPQAALYYNLRGLIFQAQGDTGTALESFELALQLDKNAAEPYLNMGNAFYIEGYVHDAIAAYQKALELRPNWTEAYCCLGRIYMFLGKLDLASQHYHEALRVDPDNLDAISGEAQILDKQGDTQAAFARLKSALASGKDDFGLAMFYAKLSPQFQCQADAIARLERISTTRHLPVVLEQQLQFALGELYDNIRNYDKAFRHYVKGNDLNPNQFNIKHHTDTIDRSIAFFSHARVAKLQKSTLSFDRPVFIVGMPRSGTTLVEQILEAHPQVHAAGEKQYTINVAHALPQILETNLSYPECLELLTSDQLDELLTLYQFKLAQFPEDCRRITLKNPFNFLHLGLLSMIFPNARVIHCVRDPLDTCLSCYFQLFTWNLDFSFDLVDTGRYYKQYQRLMSHWKEVLDLEILDVQYEALIADQEATSRQIVEYCGLEWDEQCLRFHETQRVVNTASYDQVRKPLYHHAVGRARHYDKHLERLKAALK